MAKIKAEYINLFISDGHNNINAILREVCYEYLFILLFDLFMYFFYFFYNYVSLFKINTLWHINYTWMTWPLKIVCANNVTEQR